ncbi:TonB-dependent receptor [Myxococcota bacterium]|nr:TonB-dependent receptor [Myxococcota bacterium]
MTLPGGSSETLDPFADTSSTELLEGTEDGAPLWVFGASHRRQSLEEAPSAVTIVTAEDIRRYGFRTITEVLASVRGLYVSDDRNYSYVGIRGFGRLGDYNTRLLVLVNGHAMGEPMYASSLLGRELGLDLELVERIELIRGPGSALYGTNALFGVINIVTRTAPDVRHLDGAGLRVSASADTLARGKGLLSFEHLFDVGLRVMTGVSYEYSAGQTFDYPELANAEFSGRTARASDRGRWLGVFTELAAGPLLVQGSWARATKRVPTAAFGVLPESGMETLDMRAFVEARLVLEPTEGVEITPRLFLDRYEYRGEYPYSADEGGLMVDPTDATWAGAEVVVNARLAPWLHLLGGASASDYFVADLVIEQADIGSRNASEHTFATGALFGEVELEARNVATLTLGGRIDAYETFGVNVSPRLALITTPVPGSTLKLLFGSAFRAPTPYELYYDDGTSNAPNPDLEPEVLRHFEAVVEQDLGGRGALLTLVLFHYDVDGLISAVVDPATGRERYENVERVDATGAELEVSGRLPWLGLQGSASYSFTRARVSATGERVANSPEHVASLRLRAPLGRRLHAAVLARYLGERLGLTGRPSAPAALTADLVLTWDDVVPGLDLGLGVTNLGDVRWTIPGGIEHAQDLIVQDGRAIWARASYLF